MIINNEEMIALNEIFRVECTYAREIYLNEADNKKQVSNNIESIIKNFLLLSDIEKRQVSYLIEILNSEHEIDKLTVIASLGLEH